MGFMAMLGILSLGGIVINNAIVVVDFIETKVAEGADLRQAIASAGRQRMRPILLTTLTTIGGLLPLSLFGGALFAPMTNGMIFGLAFSTVLTHRRTDHVPRVCGAARYEGGRPLGVRRS